MAKYFGSFSIPTKRLPVLTHATPVVPTAHGRIVDEIALVAVGADQVFHQGDGLLGGVNSPVWSALETSRIDLGCQSTYSRCWSSLYFSGADSENFIGPRRFFVGRGVLIGL
jgi:hypothetical protein